MDKTLQVSLDQIVPFSKARADLSSLLEKLAKKDYFVIAKKYQPKAAVVSIPYLTKLQRVYNEFRREKRFEKVLAVGLRNLDVSPEQVEKDVAEAIRQVREEKYAKSRP